jgi:hypothetical protein
MVSCKYGLQSGRMLCFETIPNIKQKLLTTESGSNALVKHLIRMYKLIGGFLYNGRSLPDFRIMIYNGCLNCPEIAD